MNKEKKEYSLTPFEATIKSLLLAVPLSVTGCYSYWLVWGWEKMAADISFIFIHYEILIPILIGGIIMHEMLHALGWVAAGNMGWNSISFGINVKAMAPYAHCNSPMPIRAYRIGVIVPGVILGLLPFLLGLVMGSGWLAGPGFLFTLAAAGDFLMLWIIRDIPNGRYVVDHPTRVGCNISE